MSQVPSQAEIDAAAAYERVFVPALFAEWAPRVAAAARIGSGQRVLDVACGTGVLAREAARRAGRAGAVAGLDRNAGMLAVAAGLQPDIEWREGLAEALPFPDRSFDAVVSQFGLMFFADRRRALLEMQRVLAPGGRLAVAVWDALDHVPAYRLEVELLERRAGGRAAEALRAPFELGDRRRLSALLAESGLAGAEVTSHRGTARFPGIRPMVEADLRGWLPVFGVVLTEDAIAEILAEAEHLLAPFARPDGSVRFEAPAHVVSAAPR